MVIEEFLEGEEVSMLAFTDGYTIVGMPPAQDHKRVFDNDEGPNTGGMGAYAPAPVATPILLKRIQEEILKPTIDSMRKDGMSLASVLVRFISTILQFKGFLMSACSMPA